MAVPKSQQVHGPRIEYLIGQAPAEAWQRLSCSDGAKGPRFYDWAAARLPAVWEFDGDEPTRQRWMLARRSITKPDELAHFLASAPLDATVADLVQVAGCRWKIEECFQSAKNKCDLDQYEVRRYVGWPPLGGTAPWAGTAADAGRPAGAPPPRPRTAGRCPGRCPVEEAGGAGVTRCVGGRSLVRPAAPGAQLPRTITAMPPTGRSLRYWAIWKGAKASLPTSSVTTSSSSMSRCSIGLSVSVWVSSFCP